MAQKKIGILYNSGEYQSLVAAMILKVRFIAEIVTMVDLFGKNQSAMASAINTITNATQDRMYCTTVVDASYTGLGHPSTDTNIVTADAKIVAEPETGYAATKELGEASSTDLPAIRAWNECYTGKGWPQIVRYLSGTYFNVHEATADSVTSTSLTDTAQFTTNSEQGKYVYIVSATNGAGQIRKVTSNTANVLTIPAWHITPTGTIKYAIVTLKGEALNIQAIKAYVEGLMWDLTDRDTLISWYKLIDYAQFDSSFTSINSGSLISPTTDTAFLEEVLTVGKKIVHAGMRTTYTAGVLA